MTEWAARSVQRLPISRFIHDPDPDGLFAAAGYVLAFNPELLTRLIRGVANSISDPTLAATIERSIDTAIRQRATVGLTGLALALYSG